MKTLPSVLFCRKDVGLGGLALGFFRGQDRNRHDQPDHGERQDRQHRQQLPLEARPGAPEHRDSAASSIDEVCAVSYIHRHCQDKSIYLSVKAAS